MLEAMLEGMLQASRDRVARLTELLALEGEIARLAQETDELKAQREALLDGVWGKGAPPCEELPQIDAEPPTEGNHMMKAAVSMAQKLGYTSPYSRAVDITGRRLNDTGEVGAYRHSPVEPMSRAPRVTMAPELMAALGRIAEFSPLQRISDHIELEAGKPWVGVDMGEPGGDKAVTAKVVCDSSTPEGYALLGTPLSMAELEVLADQPQTTEEREVKERFEQHRQAAIGASASENEELKAELSAAERKYLDRGWDEIMKGLRR